MIERLIQTLRVLAAPATAGPARHPERAAEAGALAREFEDAFVLVADCPQIELTRAQRRALERVGACLEAMGAEHDAATHGERGAVRALAQRALHELGVPGGGSRPSDVAALE